MSRLLVYTQDGLGLGHLRRTRNVAQAVLQKRPDCQVLVAGDSPAIPLLPRVPGMRYVRLPTIVKRGPDVWETRSGMSVAETLDLRARTLAALFDDFAPDAVLVDHMPAGAHGELRPLIERALARSRPPALHLGLRDILDDPAVTRRTWSDLGAYACLEHYDSVLLYGDPEVFDADEAYGLTPYAGNLRACGYVTVRELPPSRAPQHSGEHVVVMGGGGADAFPVADAFLGALPLLLADREIRATILTGPNMPAADRAALRAHAAGLPARVAEGLEDALGHVARATAVVSMAGYNSTCEVLRARKRTLLVPRRGPSAEQRMRAKLFTRRGLVHALDPDTLGAGAMAAALDGLLTTREVPDAALLPSFDGAHSAAMTIAAADRVAA